MQVEARNASELQKSLKIERTKHQICQAKLKESLIERTKNQICQAELKESRATVVKLYEQVKELNLNLELKGRECNALSKECQLLREYVIPLVRRIIRNGLPLEPLGTILDALHNGMGDNFEDEERSLLGDWKSDRQEAESSNTTTEDSESADEASANDMGISWLNLE